MFLEFKKQRAFICPPRPRSLEMASGSLFYIAAGYAYFEELTLVALITACVATSTIFHILFPTYWLRLIDYNLALLLMATCTWLILLSDFYIPYSLYAVITAIVAITFYSIHYHTRSKKCDNYYLWWHICAVLVVVCSIKSYTLSGSDSLIAVDQISNFSITTPDTQK
jgi:thiol:disulfide interchange protein